jgi:predicted ATPase
VLRRDCHTSEWRLFIARAQAVKADFAVTTTTALAVAEICHRLDGLPLAIELAAARIKLFPPQVLLARLCCPFTLLTGGPRDVPARQQTLRSTIDWSYHLLNAAEQMLFRRLGVRSPLPSVQTNIESPRRCPSYDVPLCQDRKSGLSTVHVPPS